MSHSFLLELYDLRLIAGIFFIFLGFLTLFIDKIFPRSLSKIEVFRFGSAHAEKLSQGRRKTGAIMFFIFGVIFILVAFKS